MTGQFVQIRIRSFYMVVRLSACSPLVAFFFPLVEVLPCDLKLIACEIFYRELCAAVARSINQVDIEFLPKGLHDIGQAGMSARLAELWPRSMSHKYEAVLFGYGLCSNGLVGLTARNIPLVIPRPTIALPCSSAARSDTWTTSSRTRACTSRRAAGSNAARLEPVRPGLDPTSGGHEQTYEELVAKYGEDNAKFLYEQLGNMTRNYTG